MDGSRELYRVRADPEGGVPIHIVGANGREAEGTLIDCSASGASVALPYEEPPPVAVGVEVSLEFGVPGRDEPIAVDAIVQHVCIGDVYLRYGFRFDAQRLEDPLDPSEWELFNRRRSQRIHLGGESTVEVAIAPEEGEPVAHGQLYDISLHGIGLRVEESDADAVRNAGRLRCRFALPSDPAELEVVVDVRDERPARDEAGGILFGCEVDLSVSDEPHVWHGLVEDFITLGVVL